MRTRVSPYCFRHQHAWDLKCDPTVSLEDAAKAMGHLSDYSTGKYGHGIHGRKGSGVKALIVEICGRSAIHRRLIGSLASRSRVRSGATTNQVDRHMSVAANASFMR